MSVPAAATSNLSDADSAGEPTTLLQISGLHVSFYSASSGPSGTPQYLPAVQDVSLRVPVGTSVGIVGESGSGKSVTALSLLRLLPEPPARIDGGQLLYYGALGSPPSGTSLLERRLPRTQAQPTDLLTLRGESLRQLRGNRIAMVFQEPMTALNPVFTIGDQIGEALRAHQRLDRKAGFLAAEELLQLVGIPEPRRRAKEYPHQLSGGQRQRVMIAMALSCRPDLLIADEPTTALDVTTQAQILELLARLQAELGMSLLLISHDLGVVAEVCEHVAVMYAGQVVEEAPARELFLAPRHPYTHGLLQAMPRLSSPTATTAAMDTRLREIPGRVPRLSEMPPGCRFADRCDHVQPRCRVEAPLLQPAPASSGSHLVRCHFPVLSDPADRSTIPPRAATGRPS